MCSAPVSLDHPGDIFLSEEINYGLSSSGHFSLLCQKEQRITTFFLMLMQIDLLANKTEHWPKNLQVLRCGWFVDFSTP